MLVVDILLCSALLLAVGIRKRAGFRPPSMKDVCHRQHEKPEEHAKHIVFHEKSLLPS